jgi:hypothetical protein
MNVQTIVTELSIKKLKKGTFFAPRKFGNAIWRNEMREKKQSNKKTSMFLPKIEFSKWADPNKNMDRKSQQWFFVIDLTVD